MLAAGLNESKGSAAVDGRRKILRRPVGSVDALPGTLHPVLRRVYAARGLVHSDALGRGLADLLPVGLLEGADAAATLLQRIIGQGGRILLLGDFDADGATSCALGMLALRAMGAAQVDYLVPNRFDYGYGLTPEILEVALGLCPDVIVTVDNGVSSVEGVAAANEAGVPVIITDHHLPGARLPEAAAIVNPNLATNGFPSKNLAGVGVIFYVMAALRARLRESGWLASQGLAVPALADLLDLVALGTVADLVPLDANNRILVDQGIRRIRAAKSRPGLLALLEVARRDPVGLQASDLAFAAAPRLNAAGRLEDMSLGIECLLCEDPAEARELAERLDGLNRERRVIEERMRRQAEDSLARLHLGDGLGLPYGLCLYDPDWHQGVIGILAARVREGVHRPTIAFAVAGEGMLKGSARSVDGLHVRDALEAVATRHPGLIPRFGGHARAAGLTLREQDYERFAGAFDEQVRTRLTAEDLQGVIHTDGALSADDFNLDLARLLRDAGPWGQDFPEPSFDNQLRVVSHKIVGERHLKMVLAIPESEERIDAIAFGQAERLDQIGGADRPVRVIYRLAVNSYRGAEAPQLMVEYMEPGGR